MQQFAAFGELLANHRKSFKHRVSIISCHVSVESFRGRCVARFSSSGGDEDAGGDLAFVRSQSLCTSRRPPPHSGPLDGGSSIYFATMFFIIAGVGALILAGAGASYYYWRKNRVVISDSLGPMLG